MPYCTSTGLSRPYSLSSWAWRAASMPRSPARVSMGSPGTRRMRKNASSVIPMKVGMISDRRVRMNLIMEKPRPRASNAWFLLLVAQLAAQDFSDRRLGQLGAELDHLGLLVAGEVGLAVLAHLGLGQALVLPDDHQLDGLTGLLVDHANHGAFQHAVQQGDHVLHLIRVDVEAADQHHVLLAVDDLEVPALVHGADVAALEVAVGRHDLGGLVGPLPVASHHLGALDRDLAGLARGRIIALVVHQ